MPPANSPRAASDPAHQLPAPAHGARTVRARGGQVWAGLRQIADGYFAKRIPRMAAALSYYTVFSLAPLLVIAVALAGLVFGEKSARDQISGQFQHLVGKQGGALIQTMIDHANNPAASIAATLIGLATLLIGAMGVFGELQDSLNTIWDVRTRPGQTVRGLIRSRLLSFAMVFGIGFLLLVSLVISAGVAALGALLGTSSAAWQTVVSWSDSGISLVAVGLLFAGAFKLLPDVSVRWCDVWLGALVTSLLFIAGKYLIGLYLGSSAIATTYGAMGSLAVLLIWIYYSAQVFLIGALFTHTRALHSGAPLRPTRDAEWLPNPDPAPQRQSVVADASAPR